MPRLREGQSPCPSQSLQTGFGPLFPLFGERAFPFLGSLRRTKEKQEKALALLVRQGGYVRPQCGRFPGPQADAILGDHYQIDTVYEEKDLGSQ